MIWIELLNWSLQSKVLEQFAIQIQISEHLHAHSLVLSVQS